MREILQITLGGFGAKNDAKNLMVMPFLAAILKLPHKIIFELIG